MTSKTFCPSNVPSITRDQWDIIVNELAKGDVEHVALAKTCNMSNILAAAALFSLAEWGKIELFLGVFHDSDPNDAKPRLLRPFKDGWLPTPAFFDDIGTVTADMLRYTFVGRALERIVLKDPEK